MYRPIFMEQFRKLALSAKTEGFSIQYTRYLIADHDHFIYKFIETGFLQAWRRHRLFSKECGFKEPLSYDDKINVQIQLVSFLAGF